MGLGKGEEKKMLTAWKRYFYTSIATGNRMDKCWRGCMMGVLTLGQLGNMTAEAKLTAHHNPVLASLYYRNRRLVRLLLIE